MLQADHQEALKTTENLRQEVRRLVGNNADLTGQLLTARSEIKLMKQDIERVEGHARLAESTKKLDQDEVKRLQKDLDTMQGVHMSDTKHLRDLDLKHKVLILQLQTLMASCEVAEATTFPNRKRTGNTQRQKFSMNMQLLEEEIGDMSKVLARVTASEANLQSQVAQLEETKARLLNALKEETKSREKAEMLIKEYEKGVERRCEPLYPLTIQNTASSGRLA